MLLQQYPDRSTSWQGWKKLHGLMKILRNELAEHEFIIRKVDRVKSLRNGVGC